MHAEFLPSFCSVARSLIRFFWWLAFLSRLRTACQRVVFLRISLPTSTSNSYMFRCLYSRAMSSHSRQAYEAISRLYSTISTRSFGKFSPDSMNYTHTPCKVDRHHVIQNAHDSVVLLHHASDYVICLASFCYVAPFKYSLLFFNETITDCFAFGVFSRSSHVHMHTSTL